MAQAKRKSTSAAKPKKRTTTPPKQPQARASASSDTRGSSNAPNRPRRREIAASICFVLGVFSFIGYFDSEPLFISFFTGFVKGLVGPGFWALPPALIMCSVILMFHKGYPVLLRTISTLSLTIVVGSWTHTVLYSIPASGGSGRYDLSLGMLGKLWTDGVIYKSGGVIGGGISQLFLVLFGLVGTIITLTIVAFVLGMVAFNATVSGVLGAYKNREKRYYDVEPYHDDEALPYDQDVADQEEIARRHRYPLVPMWKRKKIDIPLDEKRAIRKDYFADDPMSELYNPTPNVRPPDKLLKDSPPPETAGQGEMFGVAGEEDDSEGPMQEDMPLDIPFINEKWEPTRRPAPVVPPIIEENFMTGSDPFSTGLPPEVTSQILKAKKPAMPAVPEPEGGGADIKYTFPPLDLLSRGDRGGKGAGDSEVNLNAERLEAAFQSFGINVNISKKTRGPSVTLYEAELEAGIKLSKLTSLADDIALALGTIGVRIYAMPNKASTVGIEVPNKSVSKVHLRDVIESPAFSQTPTKPTTFALGVDISGQPIVGEISKLPHLLVAGTTGSGKSVCLNSIILSILYKATPKDVRFIMLDPKMVEFKVYNDIPHLLVPVVTDVKKAAGALQWATFEMMKRYSLFAETNARDIAGYNIAAHKSNEERQPLPNIIVLIDELADLMMIAGKEVEEAVCRIAQMGRAAGMHLIIATQSPRANVITGLMKANIPSRIAFKVASALESQIILDPGQAADKLVGNGDMLYSPTGAAKPMRLQGTWVSDKEREKVVNFIKKSGETQYSEEVMHEIDKASVDKSSGSGDDFDGETDHDELLPQAVDVIFETGQASVSMLQRRLKLGYARAARIVDQMEEMGIVGRHEGSKPRELLITRDQWRQMQYATGVAPPDIRFDNEQ